MKQKYRMPAAEARRVKKDVLRRNGRKFRSARRAVDFCQQRNIGQAMKMLDNYYN